MAFPKFSHALLSSLFTKPGQTLYGKDNESVAVLDSSGNPGDVYTLDTDGVTPKWAAASGGGSGDASTIFSYGFNTLTMSGTPAPIPIGSSVNGLDTPWATVTDLNPSDHAAVQLSPGIYHIHAELLWLATVSGNITCDFKSNGNYNIAENSFSATGASLTDDGSGDKWIIKDDVYIVADADRSPFLFWIEASNSAAGQITGQLKIAKIG